MTTSPDTREVKEIVMSPMFCLSGDYIVQAARASLLVVNEIGDQKYDFRKHERRGKPK